MSRRGIHSFRRWFQLAFLTAFLVLLTLTVWPLGQVYLGAFLVGDPLIAINSLSNGVWKTPMLLAAAMLLLPLVAGRAFCGYACPTGAIIEMTGGKSRPSRLSPRVRAFLRTLPSIVLAVSLGLLLFASSVYLFFDPLATLTRTATILLYPLLDRVARLTGDAAYLVPQLRFAVDATDAVLAGRIIFTRPLTYGLQLGVLGMFVSILAISWFEPRLWCRHLCPLGALLGFVGRFAVFGRVVDTDACISCGKCARVCPLDAVADDFHSTDTSRCQLGLECADVCPTNAVSLGFLPKRSVYSPSKRALIGTGALGALAGFFGYTGLAHATRDPRLVRPPGAPSNSEVLALCTRCGQCMKTCPTNVLQPSLSKSGPLGVFTPEMDYRVGFCEWSCSECGKVCPTGAIAPLDLDEKRRTRIGRAYIDRNRCIPWADGKSCLVCQELCPIADKAIALEDAEITDASGNVVTLSRPVMVPDRCIGCGVCEYNCPVPNESAITVRALEDPRPT